MILGSLVVDLLMLFGLELVIVMKLLSYELNYWLSDNSTISRVLVESLQESKCSRAARI